MKLSKRIKQIIDTCPSLDIWADIGADHGLTGAGLLESKKARIVLAADISRDSLSKAAELKAALSIDNMLLRVGDGFAAVLGDNADGAVISGMGAPLIINIINAHFDYAKKLEYMVLSPNIYPERLRAFLAQNGWMILNESIIAENGKYYPVMLVKRGDSRVLSRTELYSGVNVKKDGDYYAFIKYKLKLSQRILSESEGRNTEAANIIEALKNEVG